MKLNFTKNEINFLAESIKYCTVKDNIGLLESNQLVSILNCKNINIVKKFITEQETQLDRGMKNLISGKEMLHANKKEIGRFFKMTYDELWAYSSSLFSELLANLRKKDIDHNKLVKEYEKKVTKVAAGSGLKQSAELSDKYKDRLEKLFNSGKEFMKENKDKAMSALKDLEFGEFFNHMKSLITSIRNTIAQYIYIQLGYEKADLALIKRAADKEIKDIAAGHTTIVTQRELVNSDAGKKIADYITNFNNSSIMAANALITAMAILTTIGLGILGKMLFPVIRNLIAKIKQMFEKGKKGKKVDSSAIKASIGVIKKIADKSEKKHLKKRVTNLGNKKK
ncbi:hypothetical protein M0R36_10470 [bacterium]|jgi:hypothetical protein|nr:hypothetical protein [bacterium]